MFMKIVYFLNVYPAVNFSSHCCSGRDIKVLLELSKVAREMLQLDANVCMRII